MSRRSAVAVRAGAAVAAGAWLVFGFAGALPMAGARPVASATASGCSGTTGVTVVVDYASAGGGVVVGCARGAPASGIDALSAAGFVATQVHSTGFVCQINGRGNTNCQQYPGAGQPYWNYWHGRSGSSWQYSSEGAGTYAPPPGSVEGWAFGPAQTQPSMSPGTAVGPPPAPPPPAPSPPPPAAGGATGSGPRSVHPGGGASAPPASAPSAPAPVPAETTTETTTTASPAPGGAGSAQPTTTARALAARHVTSSGSGPPWAALGTTGAVLALGAAGAWQARRRFGGG